MPFVEPCEAEQDGFTVNNLAINIPCPHPTITEPLTLSVDTNKIIVVSWYAKQETWRWTIDWIFYWIPKTRGPNWVNEHDGVDIVVDFIEKFMSEEIATYRTYDDPLGSGVAGTITSTDVANGYYKKGQRGTEIRSWRGSLDVTLGPV